MRARDTQERVQTFLSQYISPKETVEISSQILSWNMRSQGGGGKIRKKHSKVERRNFQADYNYLHRMRRVCLWFGRGRRKLKQSQIEKLIGNLKFIPHIYVTIAAR